MTDTMLAPDDRPRASAARVERLSDDRWLLSVRGVPKARVSGGIAEVVTALDGRSADEIARDLKYPLAEVLEIVARLSRLGVLDGSNSPQRRALTFRPPMTIQLASRRVAACIGGLGWLATALSISPLGIAAALLALCGGLASLIAWPAIASAVTSPIPVALLAPLAISLVIATLIHEIAHGATLAHFGAMPARAGLMIFLLAPAFFVDVTNGWSLPRPRQRVAVALAGPVSHGLLGAVALCVAAATQSATQRCAALFACIALAIALFNLMPFVKFDGYLALMAGLDEPHLRQRSMRDAGSWLASWALGATRDEREFARWWSVPFGLMCAVVPMMLTGIAFLRICAATVVLGPTGLLITATLTGLLLAVAVRGVARAIRILRETGVSRVRVLGTGLVLSVATTGLLATPVPMTHMAGYVVEGDRVALVQPLGVMCRPFPVGATVFLATNGVIPVPIGVGTVGSGKQEISTVPVSALYPLEVENVRLPAWSAGLTSPSRSIDSRHSTGLAAVSIGNVPATDAIADWLGTLAVAVIPNPRDPATLACGSNEQESRGN